MTAKEPQETTKKRGFLRRVVDWLLWDGEDDLDDVLVPTSDESKQTVRAGAVTPPARSIDSIDWIAFAEGRPQSDAGTMLERSEDEVVARDANDAADEDAHEQAYENDYVEPGASVASQEEHKPVAAMIRGAEQVVEANPAEPVLAAVAASVADAIPGRTESKSPKSAPPTTAAVMASIHWE